MPPKFGNANGNLPQPRSMQQQQHQQQPQLQRRVGPPLPASASQGHGQGVQGGGFGSNGRHTIILVQQTSDAQSRTYTDHESVNEAMRSLIAVFEAKQMARQNTGKPVSYSTDQLLGFIDGLHDVSMLCFDRNMRAYMPFDRKFIKDKIYTTLSRDAGPGR
jgi:hypothetical protein